MDGRPSPTMTDVAAEESTLTRTGITFFNRYTPHGDAWQGSMAELSH